MRRLRRVHDLLQAGFGLAVGDVLPDGRAEQNRFLQHESDLATPRLATILPDVDPIDENGPLLGLVES